MPARLLVMLGLLFTGCDGIGLELTYFDTADPFIPDRDDTGPDTTNETDHPSAPQLESFDLSERSADSTIHIAFEASDDDGDLSGGVADLTLGGQSYSFDIPGDLDDYSVNGTSRFHIDGSHLSGGETVNGVLTLEDAAGHPSNSLTDSLTLEITSQTYNVQEIGDTENQTQSLGVIELPAILEGDIYRASNDGYSYTGDIDFVEFRVSATTPAQFTLTWDASGSDYDLHLLVNGNTEAQSVQDGAAQPETFTRTLQPGTNYVVAIAGWNGNSGDYTLVIDSP